MAANIQATNTQAMSGLMAAAGLNSHFNTGFTNALGGSTSLDALNMAMAGGMIGGMAGLGGLAGASSTATAAQAATAAATGSNAVTSSIANTQASPSTATATQPITSTASAVTSTTASSTTASATSNNQIIQNVMMGAAATNSLNALYGNAAMYGLNQTAATAGTSASSSYTATDFSSNLLDQNGLWRGFNTAVQGTSGSQANVASASSTSAGQTGRSAIASTAPVNSQNTASTSDPVSGQVASATVPTSSSNVVLGQSSEISNSNLFGITGFPDLGTQKWTN